MNKKNIVSASKKTIFKLKLLAKEKEGVRRKLAINAGELKKSRKLLEKTVLKRTKNLEIIKAKDEAILTSIGDGLVVVDKAGNIIYVNKTFEEMLGWKLQEVIGRSMVEVVPREDQGGNRVLFKEIILSRVLLGKKFIADFTNPFYFIRKDKSRFPVSIIVSPVMLGRKIIGAVEVFRDITKERQIDKAKTEFVSLASHQLRTPLSSISWYTEMLSVGDAGELNDKQKKYLSEVSVGNQRMIKLVNTLLDVSRLDLGTFAISPEPTDVVGLMQSVVDEQNLQIKDRKIEFSALFEKGIPLIQADPKILRIVFQNLLSNALKFTPEKGKVKIDLRLIKRGKLFEKQKINKESIVIIVSDTGFGIPKNQHDKIFTKLFRADNAQEKDTEGTGLGLYIVKSVIDHLGGMIWFDSEENKGTNFYVTLPLAEMKRKEGIKMLE